MAMAPERRRRQLVLGTDFSGLCAPSLALKKLRVKHKYAFASDSDASCRKILAHCHSPGVIYPAVQLRDQRTTPKVDLYMCGFPCQPFSDQGRHAGIQDKHNRGCLVAHSLEYVLLHRPAVCIMENVPGLLAKRHRPLLNCIRETLVAAGYVLRDKLLDTSDFGLPQKRCRLYLVCIRRECLRRRKHSCATGLSHVFPSRIPCAKLKSMVVRCPAREFKMLPSGTSRQAQLWRANVLKAYSEMILATPNANPFLVPVVVDMKSSMRFSTFAVNRTPCLTRRRCADRGYWCSFKGDVLSIREMAALQGIPADFDWEGAGVSPYQFGGMIGNCMSVNVLACLLPEVLYEACLVSLRQRDAMRRLAREQ